VLSILLVLISKCCCAVTVGWMCGSVYRQQICYFTPDRVVQYCNSASTLCLKKNCTPKAGRHKFCYFPDTKKIRNICFVGNFILNKSWVLLWWRHYDVIYTQEIRRRCRRMRSVMNSMRLFVPWLPCKPCSWYSTRTKLFELNRSATEWQCLVWKIIMCLFWWIYADLHSFFETQCTWVCLSTFPDNGNMWWREHSSTLGRSLVSECFVQWESELICVHVMVCIACTCLLWVDRRYRDLNPKRYVTRQDG